MSPSIPSTIPIIPFTCVVNICSLMSVVCNKSEYLFPANMGALFAGSLMSQVYPKRIATKYNLSTTTVKVGDIFLHWLPVIYMYHNTKHIRKKHLIFSSIFPIIYFLSHVENSRQISVKHTISNLQKTYPGVPLYVFSFYYVGILCSRYPNRYLRKPKHLAKQLHFHQ